MTIKCGRCGKRFDYEKYYGICPKCSAFNRKEEGGNGAYGGMADAAHERLHREYDGNSVDHGAMPGYHGEAQMETVREARQKAPGAQPALQAERTGGKIWKVLPGLFVLVSVCSVVMTIVLCNGMKRKAEEESWLHGPVWVEDYTAGESFDFSGRRGGEVWAEELIAADTVEGFPPGESLVAVHISVSSHEEGGSWESIESPHLQVGDVYKPPVSGYQIEEYLVGIPMPGKEISDMELFTFPDVDTKGVIYYFAPLDKGPMQLVLTQFVPGEFEKQLSGRLTVDVPLYDGEVTDSVW